MEKVKTRSVTMKVLGAIPYVATREVLWKVRMIAPYFPFHVDSALCYQSKAGADAVAAKWRRRKVIVKITG